MHNVWRVLCIFLRKDIQHFLHSCSPLSFEVLHVYGLQIYPQCLKIVGSRWHGGPSSSWAQLLPFAETAWGKTFAENAWGKTSMHVTDVQLLFSSLYKVCA